MKCLTIFLSALSMYSYLELKLTIIPLRNNPSSSTRNNASSRNQTNTKTNSTARANVTLLMQGLNISTTMYVLAIPSQFILTTINFCSCTFICRCTITYLSVSVAVIVLVYIVPPVLASTRQSIIG